MYRYGLKGSISILEINSADYTERDSKHVQCKLTKKYAFKSICKKIESSLALSEHLIAVNEKFFYCLLCTFFNASS